MLQNPNRKYYITVFGKKARSCERYYEGKRDGWIAALKWALDSALYIHSSDVAIKIVEQELEAVENG